MKKVAIIGGGYAGMAAGVELAAAGVSVTIDGVLTASRFSAVSAAHEIYLIQRIKGG